MSDKKDNTFIPSNTKDQFSQSGYTEKKDVLRNSDLPSGRALVPEDKDDLLKKLKKNKKD